eukprot:36989-Rhodomonas_salina.3
MRDVGTSPQDTHNREIKRVDLDGEVDVLAFDLLQSNQIWALLFQISARIQFESPGVKIPAIMAQQGLMEEKEQMRRES